MHPSDLVPGLMLGDDAELGDDIDLGHGRDRERHGPWAMACEIQDGARSASARPSARVSTASREPLAAAGAWCGPVRGRDRVRWAQVGQGAIVADQSQVRERGRIGPARCSAAAWDVTDDAQVGARARIQSNCHLAAVAVIEDDVSRRSRVATDERRHDGPACAGAKRMPDAHRAVPRGWGAALPAAGNPRSARGFRRALVPWRSTIAEPPAAMGVPARPVREVPGWTSGRAAGPLTILADPMLLRAAPPRRLEQAPCDGIVAPARSERRRSARSGVAQAVVAEDAGTAPEAIEGCPRRPRHGRRGAPRRPAGRPGRAALFNLLSAFVISIQPDAPDDLRRKAGRSSALQRAHRPPGTSIASTRTSARVRLGSIGPVRGATRRSARRSRSCSGSASVPRLDERRPPSTSRTCNRSRQAGRRRAHPCDRVADGGWHAGARILRRGERRWTPATRSRPPGVREQTIRDSESFETAGGASRVKRESV